MRITSLVLAALCFLAVVIWLLSSEAEPDPRKASPKADSPASAATDALAEAPEPVLTRPPNAALSIRWRDPDGRPIAGLQCALWMRDELLPLAPTDATGWTEFASFAADLRGATLLVTDTRFAAPPSSLAELRAAGHSSLERRAWPREHPQRVRVLRGDQPLAHVVVRGAGGAVTAETDADGRAVLSLATFELSQELRWLAAPGFEAAALPSPWGRGAALDLPELTLQSSKAETYQLRDEQGAPIGVGELRLSEPKDVAEQPALLALSIDPSGSIASPAPLDAYGRMEWRGADRRWRVCTAIDNADSAATSTIKLKIAHEAHQDAVGKIMGPDVPARSSANVALLMGSGPSARWRLRLPVDAAGHFEIPWWLRPSGEATHALSAELLGLQATRSLTATDFDAPVIIELQSQREVRGSVRLPDGQPAGGVQVVALNHDREVLARSATDASGAFHLALAAAQKDRAIFVHAFDFTGHSSLPAAAHDGMELRLEAPIEVYITARREGETHSLPSFAVRVLAASDDGLPTAIAAQHAWPPRPRARGEHGLAVLHLPAPISSELGAILVSAPGAQSSIVDLDTATHDDASGHRRRLAVVLRHDRVVAGELRWHRASEPEDPQDYRRLSVRVGASRATVDSALRFSVHLGQEAAVEAHAAAGTSLPLQVYADDLLLAEVPLAHRESRTDLQAPIEIAVSGRIALPRGVGPSLSLRHTRHPWHTTAATLFPLVAPAGPIEIRGARFQGIAALPPWGELRLAPDGRPLASGTLRVLAEGQTPLANAHLRIEDPELLPEARLLLAGATDARGRLAFVDLPIGALLVTVNYERQGQPFTAAESLVLRPGTADVTLLLQESR